MGMNGSKFENETLFLSFTAFVTAGDEGNGTNFHVRNRMVGAIEMSGDWFVNIIIPHGAKMLIIERSEI